jgi:hypothetical protein
MEQSNIQFFEYLDVVCKYNSCQKYQDQTINKTTHKSNLYMDGVFSYI